MHCEFDAYRSTRRWGDGACEGGDNSILLRMVDPWRVQAPTFTSCNRMSPHPGSTLRVCTTPLKDFSELGLGWVILLQSWTSTSYFSNSTGSCVTSGRFSPIHWCSWFVPTWVQATALCHASKFGSRWRPWHFCGFATREMQCLRSTKEHITFSEKSRNNLCRSVQHDGSMIAQTGKVMHYTTWKNSGYSRSNNVIQASVEMSTNDLASQQWCCKF